MQYLQGNDRDQMFMLSLEEAVARDAFVRVVDVFVDAIDFKSFEFVNTECKEEGRPDIPLRCSLMINQLIPIPAPRDTL